MQEADDVAAGKYGPNPEGKSPDYWHGRRCVLHELNALHDYPINALEHRNAALRDAIETLKDFVTGKRHDAENISGIINGALELNAPNADLRQDADSAASQPKEMTNEK